MSLRIWDPSSVCEKPPTSNEASDFDSSKGGMQKTKNTSLDFGESFLLVVELSCLQLSFFAYSLLRYFLDALSHCKQRSSNVRKKLQLQAKKLKL